jgi:hypothetical protein
MSNEDLQHKQELLQALKQRLNQLELKEARFGTTADPSILNEIADLQKRIQTIEKEIQPQLEDTFATTPLLEDFPSSLKSDFLAAEEVWLIGASLVRTIRPNYHVLVEKLNKRHTIRVLTVHPTDALIEPSVARSFKPTSIERKRSEILDTLQVLCELRRQTSDRLQIRTIHYPLVYGANVINPEKISGVLYIKLYPYKLPIWKPKFVLHASAGGWYDYYLKEIHTLWDAGTNWNCDGGV